MEYFRHTVATSASAWSNGIGCPASSCKRPNCGDPLTNLFHAVHHNELDDDDDSLYLDTLHIPFTILSF